MFNSNQEDEIRNLLTIVTIYFQLEEKNNNNGLIEQQKMLCRQAIKRLIVIMNVDGSLPIRKTLNGHSYQLIDFGNVILNKLGYENDGREVFLSACIKNLVDKV